MPSTVAVADSLTNNSVPIHKISVNEDEQNGKIEVQEEIKNGEGNSEGSAPPPLDDENHIKDGTHILEPMGLDEHLRSGISTPKQPVANPDTPMIEKGNDSCRISNSDERRGKNFSSLDGKSTVFSDLQALRYDSGETITHEIQLFGQKVSAEFTEGGHQEVSQDLQQTSSRLDVQETWARSLSPAADSGGGNKRPADRCEFYSRGWCINGSSCRFLHVRDPVISHNKDGALDAAKIKNKLINGEGSKDTTKRPAQDSFSDLASSEAQCGENQRLNTDNDLHMHKDEGQSSMPFRDIGRETLGCKSYLAGYGSSSPSLLKDDSLNKDSYRSGMLPSSSVLSSYKYQNTEVPSYASVLDDTSYKRTHLMLDYHHLPFSNRSVDKWPSYLTSSSSNLDHVGDQKLLDHSQEYCYSRSISLHNQSSALPGCGTEPFSRTDLSGDTERSCGYKTKVYFNDWETSTPFRPSTFLGQIIPPPESLYDPFRDSIEQTSTAEKDLAANERETADRAIAHQENINTSSIEEKHSRSVSPRGQKKKQTKLEKLQPSCENIPPPESIYDPIHDSIGHTSTAEKDLSANERKTVDRAIAHQENTNTSSKKEKHSRSVNRRGEKRKQSKLDKLRDRCEINTDFRRDESVNYESGVMKHFRAALVESVKELLKPTWREGLLMKDAYKMIVKKAVDKIINSLTHDQIPDTTESINQYLSVSKPKVAKLIKGYVEKYGKS